MTFTIFKQYLACVKFSKPLFSVNKVLCAHNDPKNYPNGFDHYFLVLIIMLHDSESVKMIHFQIRFCCCLQQHPLKENISIKSIFIDQSKELSV